MKVASMLASLFALTVMTCAANVDVKTCPSESVVTINGATFNREDCFRRAEDMFFMSGIIEVECKETGNGLQDGQGEIFYISHVEHTPYINRKGATVYVGVDDMGVYGFTSQYQITWDSEKVMEEWLYFNNFQKVYPSS